MSLKVGISLKGGVALDDLSEVEETRPLKLKKKKVLRQPSSIAKETTKRKPSSTFRIRDREENLFNNFNQEASEVTEDPIIPANESVSNFGGAASFRNLPREQVREKNDEPNSDKKTPSNFKPLGTGIAVLNSPGFIKLPTANNDSDVNSDSEIAIPIPGNPGSSFTEKPVCSANIGSGSFSSPISVALTCTTASTISYCLSEGSCCDPTNVSTYTAPIPVGAEAKTYCLSYLGEDANGNESVIVENTYTFNPGMPDIQVAHNKIVYQTTQLDGYLSLSSLDFGTSNTFAGVLNLKENDPVVRGLTTCQDIVEDYGTVAPPIAPIFVLAPTDVSVRTPAQQIDILLDTVKLVYGDNFITSYMQNASFGDVYSCSTTKVILEDFPYFETISSNSVVNGAAVMEFSGGFTSTGFFEAPQPVLVRGPAGSSTEDQTGQELRSGLTSVFY